MLIQVFCLALSLAVTYLLSLPTGLALVLEPEWALLFIAFLGRMTLGLKAPKLWEKLWAICLSCLWLALTAQGLWHDSAAFQTLTAGGLDLACAYVWRASLFLGLTMLLYRKGNEPSDVAMVLLAIPCAGLLVWLHPQQSEFVLFPLALALGCLPYHGWTTRYEWALGLAEILEMLSLQMVAWTVVLTLLNPLGEALSARWLDAIFSFFATSVSGWIASGLLWGASTTLRRPGALGT